MAAPGLLRAAEPAYRNPAYKRGSMRHLGVRGGTRTLIGRA
jgi:hypothetical protein